MIDSGAAGPLLKNLSQAQYQKLSTLLDASLDLDAGERNTWLEAIACEDPESAALLREMFAAREASGSTGFLGTQELFQHALGAVLDPDAASVGKSFGPYRVLSLLGRGGMGSVWLAERIDGVFTRQVALKLVQPLLMGPMVMERLARERQILAGLNHPNIARLFDAGFAADGQPYLALEYIVGTPLTTYCDAHRLTIRERLALYLQVLSAVQYAHASLVIHRDLKPSNILVTEDGQVRLLDFGIATLLSGGEAKETEVTQLGGRALTPEYAAPEQIGSAPITTAADVYSLGVMLYELLTGARPYRLARVSRGALEEAILKADAAPPSRTPIDEPSARLRGTTTKKLRRSLEGELDAIVLKALKKPPIARYAAASAFGDDITRFLNGELVLAQRDSMAYRAVKFARRHRVGIAVTAGLLLTLAAGLAATSYEARIAARQRDVAEQAQLRSLTQTAAARLANADISSAMSLVLEVLPRAGVPRDFTPEALNVFEQARAGDAALAALTGHTNRVRSAVYSPDGTRVLTASWDQTARLWDAASGQELLRFSGHSDRVWSAAFSADGRRVVTASHDKTARVWDAASGRELMALAHPDRVTSAAFSPDGRRIVTGSYDKLARIFDAASGALLRTLPGHTDLVMTAVFSPDGRRVLTASHDKTARLWDVDTGAALMTLSGHTDWVKTAAFSADGQRVITASADKTARIWDAASGRQILLLTGHTDRLTSAVYSNDGRRALTASFDKTARIWDTATGRELARFSGHTAEVVGATFSADGQRAVTASYDGTARFWDARGGRELLSLNGHSEPVACAVFSPDGRRVVTGSYDKTARTWDTQTGRALVTFQGHTDQVVSVAFSPDGRFVLTASPDRTARLWDAESGVERQRFEGHTDQVVGATFSPDGRRIVTASLDKSARVWDVGSGRQLVLLSGHTDMVETAYFSADGLRIVTASQDKTARIWDAQTGRPLKVIAGHDERVEAAVFSPDGRHILTASADKTARIWDVESGRELVVLAGHGDLVEIAAFSPDGKFVVTASDDKTARIWEAASGREIKLLGGHTDRLWFAAFSPDGTRVVTSSDDKTARIWDARAPSLETQISFAHAAQFDALSDAERFKLGLPAPEGVRRWGEHSACDAAAAAPYDPERRAPGAMPGELDADTALAACTDAAPGHGQNTARELYQRGRAEQATGNFVAAKADFEAARSDGYRAAELELGMLLTDARNALLDVPRALSLEQHAFSQGVTRAAFELGTLYEHGVHDIAVRESARAAATGTNRLATDPALAQAWYRKAADAHDPEALAWFGARAMAAAAAAAADAPERRAHELEALGFYSAAAARARAEDWPDAAWNAWRYRRASFARLLAREGLEHEVAEAYDEVLRRFR